MKVPGSGSFKLVEYIYIYIWGACDMRITIHISKRVPGVVGVPAYSSTILVVKNIAIFLHICKRVPGVVGVPTRVRYY